MKVNLLKFLLCCFAICLLCSCGNNIEESTSMNDGESEKHSLTEDVYETEPSEPDAVGMESNDIVSSNTQSRCFYGEYTGTELTYTGYEPLSKNNFSLDSQTDLSQYAKTMISHSYGVASDEEPHLISVQNQQFFDERGFDAVCLDNRSDDKTVYLTFDCGYENGYTSKILDVLKEKDVTAAFFCTLPQVKENPELISRMIKEGHIVGNHSVTHPDFSTLDKNSIIEEIKGFDDHLRENFGYSAFYFRYPQGKYSEFSLSILNELGYKCVFWSLAYADWDLQNQKGAENAYKTVMSRIHPGAVILLHSVSPDNANALADIIDGVREKGYTFASLDNL